MQRFNAGQRGELLEATLRRYHAPSMRHLRTRTFLSIGIALSACLGESPTKQETETVQPELGSENAGGSGGGTAQAGATASGVAGGRSEGQGGEIGFSGASSGGNAGSPNDAPGGAGGVGTDAGGGSAGVSNGGSSAGTAGSAGSAGSGNTGGSALGFFVSTPSDSGGNLGGLAGADALCETLAAEVGAGDRTWRAYLSTSDQDARDRIGDGPWANANGVIVAFDIAELHTLTGDVDLFIDHEGNRINGQWAGSPTPNQHDVMTGSNPDGTAAAATCDDWTSNVATPGPNVGHSDGLGPGMNAAAPFNSWNSSHAPAGCSQAQLNAVGGAGRLYCFAAD